MKGKKGQKTEEAQQTQKMVREMVLKDVPTIISALYNGIYELDESSQAIVLKKVGAACAQSVREMREKIGLEYPKGVDLDAACCFYTRAALHNERLKRDFSCKREGNTIVVSDPICDVFGGCGCRLVLAGLIEPSDSLCRFCQPGFWEDNFEYITGRRPEKMEFPESHTMGHRFCVAKCHFKPTKKALSDKDTGKKGLQEARARSTKKGSK
jgi:hypothetical protein